MNPALALAFVVGPIALFSLLFWIGVVRWFWATDTSILPSSCDTRDAEDELHADLLEALNRREGIAPLVEADS